ncbi:MAG: tetratricopeptide repeat protein, partial [Thermoanaerobaculia bacterium]
RGLPLVLLFDGQGRENARLAGLDPEAFARRSVELCSSARAPEAPRADAGDDDPLGLAARARLALGEGARSEASLLFERAARAFEQEGCRAPSRSLEEAEALARARLSIAEHLESQGQARRAEGHYASALAALQRWDARSAEIQLLRAASGVGLALAARGQGRLGEARETLTRLIEGSFDAPPLLGAGRGQALFLLARLLAEEKDDEAARERFAQCVRECPGTRYGERSRRYLADPAADLDSTASGSSP